MHEVHCGAWPASHSPELEPLLVHIFFSGVQERANKLYQIRR